MENTNHQNKLYDQYSELVVEVNEVSEKIIYNLLTMFQKLVDDDIKIFTSKENISISYRIKDFESIKEKINRKQYSDIRDIEDFFGVRILVNNLLDEENIYNALKEKYEICNTTSEYFEFDFSDNLTQQNGENIFKFKAKYINESILVPIEIQIKSFFHSMWGETEHRAVYKPSYYDSTVDFNKSLVSNMTSILKPIENQLKLMKELKNIETQSLMQLFYLYTKDDVCKAASHFINADTYQKFHNILEILDKKKILKKYLSCCLDNSEYKKEKYEFSDEYSDKEMYDFKFTNIKHLLSIIYYKDENEVFTDCDTRRFIFTEFYNYSLKTSDQDENFDNNELAVLGFSTFSEESTNSDDKKDSSKKDIINNSYELLIKMYNKTYNNILKEDFKDDNE